MFSVSLDICMFKLVIIHSFVNRTQQCVLSDQGNRLVIEKHHGYILEAGSKDQTAAQNVGGG